MVQLIRRFEGPPWMPPNFAAPLRSFVDKSNELIKLLSRRYTHRLLRLLSFIFNRRN